MHQHTCRAPASRRKSTHQISNYFRSFESWNIFWQETNLNSTRQRRTPGFNPEPMPLHGKGWCAALGPPHDPTIRHPRWCCAHWSWHSCAGTTGMVVDRDKEFIGCFGSLGSRQMWHDPTVVSFLWIECSVGRWLDFYSIFIQVQGCAATRRLTQWMPCALSWLFSWHLLGGSKGSMNGWGHKTLQTCLDCWAGPQGTTGALAKFRWLEGCRWGNVREHETSVDHYCVLSASFLILSVPRSKTQFGTAYIYNVFLL